MVADANRGEDVVGEVGYVTVRACLLTHYLTHRQAIIC